MPVAFVWRRFFGFDLAGGKVTVRGLGNTPISFAGRQDVARYVGFVFTNLSAEKLEWKIFRVEGERTVSAISNFILPLAIDVLLNGIPVVQRDIEILRREDGKNPGD
jgi:hypothetical protein